MTVTKPEPMVKVGGVEVPRRLCFLARPMTPVVEIGGFLPKWEGSASRERRRYVGALALEYGEPGMWAFTARPYTSKTALGYAVTEAPAGEDIALLVYGPTKGAVKSFRRATRGGAKP